MKENNVVPSAAALAATNIRAVPNPPDELESLFRKHYTQIFLTAHRITGNANDSEDVLQTVFLRLARREKPLQLSPNPEAYLKRAAVNAALDIIRSRQLTKSVSLEDAAPELFDSRTQNPEAEHADREMRKLIQQAIAQLGEKTAEMFVLRYFEGYDNREIAESLGTSQMVVAVMLHRARSRMRKEIGTFLERDHD